MLPNRLKFFFSGSFLEFVNARISDDPYGQLAARAAAKADVVVDVCGGTGFLGRRLASQSRSTRVLCVDLSPELLRYGHKRVGRYTSLEFIRADARRLPFADQSIGTVVSTFAMHELSPTARDLAICEMRRILTPTGSLLIVDIDEPPRWRPAFHAYLFLSHGRRATGVLRERLASQLREQGFVIESRIGPRGRLLPFQLIEARPSSGITI
jgi:demethylmenaquinone methyltransferase/2-methoxy-6-polyprenyl-1,4-benzoquinol methylase